MSKASNKSSDEEQLSSDDDSYDDDNKSNEKDDESDDDSDDRSDGKDSEEEDGDNYSDYRSENSEEFNDEETPNTRYVVSQRYTDDEDGETTHEEYWWEGREKLIAAILLCWCCLCLIIIAVVLGVMLGKNNRDKEDVKILPAPTNRPTFAPQPLPPSAFTPSPTDSGRPTATITISPTIRPTGRPSTSPTDSFAPTISIPEELDIAADQDTYVQYNVSKEFQGEEYGDEDTFLVQNGPIRDELLPDSIGLITFPVENVPAFSRIAGMEKSAILRLTHVVSVEERPSANYTIIRVPETKSAVEYFHGFYFIPPEDNSTEVLVGPTFPVSPNDTVIDIDISSLLYNYTLEDNKKAKQLFLMIENRGPEQIEGGDRFYSRESKSPPHIILNFNKQENSTNASNQTQE